MRRRTAPVIPFHAPTLADKLKQLGELSPGHLRAVEMLLDQMIHSLKANTEKAVAR